MKAKVKRDTATARLRELASPQRRVAALRKGGEAVRDFLRRFWERKDAAEPNQWFSAGSIRTHFWNQIAQSVDEKVTTRGNEATVTVKDHRLAQKIYGGPIFPVKAKALTIPNHPDAHGVSARELERQLGIKLFILKVRGEAYLAGKKGRSVVRYYMLRRSVNQAPWPKSFPERRSISRVLKDGVRKYYLAWKNKTATSEP